MGKVRCMKMSSAAYAALDTKNPEVLYFVNENGDFGTENIEPDGLIYLGEKLLSGQGGAATPFSPADPMANPQGCFFVQLQADSTTSAWKAALQGLTAYYVGLRIVVFNSIASTTSATLNVNQLGAIPIRRYGSTAPPAIPVGSVTTLTYAAPNGDPAFIIDTYNFTTYYQETNLRRFCYLPVAPVVGHFYGSLCALTLQGQLASFTRTGQAASTSSFTYGRLPVGLQFPIGTPILYRAAYDAPGSTINSSAELSVSRQYVDIRYSMNYSTARIAYGTCHQFYIKVSVNREARTWTPVQNATVADHIVTHNELEAGCFYIFIGNTYNSTRYHMAFHPDPVPAYYDGQRMVPYGEWLNEQLADAVADQAAAIDILQEAATELGGLSALLGDDQTSIADGSTTLALPVLPTTGATFDIDLHLTVSTADVATPAKLIEAAIAVGHMESDEWVTDQVVASGNVSLPADATFANLALTGTFRGGQSAATHVRVSYASAGGSFILRRHSAITPLDGASQLRVRTFTPVGS